MSIQDLKGILEHVEDNYPNDKYLIDLIIESITVTKIEVELNVNLADLKNTLKHTSKDETRPWLCGVAFDNNHMVATTGHTLKCVELGEFEGSFIVPREAIDTILRLAKSFNGRPEIFLKFDDEFCYYSDHDCEYKARLIKREFPKWSFVVPKSFKHSMHILNWDYKSFKKSLDKFKKVALSVRNGDVWLCHGTSENEEIIIGECSPSLDIEIGFNASYLEIASEGLKEFEIKFNDELKPTQVNKAIVMPLKL